MSHNHVLYDSNPHFKIDPKTRQITNETSTNTTIIQHDHNSERITVECPRYIDGHDLSLCNLVEIHYANVDNVTKAVGAGVYTVSDLQVKTDDENAVVCSWLISSNATQLVGELQFLVRFSCVDENTGRVDYAWHTAVCNNISISHGIYNGETSSDNPVPAYNFVTTIDGSVLRFFVGTKAQYNMLTYEEQQDLFAIITDDTTKRDILNSIQILQTEVNKLKTQTPSFTAPELSTTKKLDEAGFYMISVRLVGDLPLNQYSCCTIYWDGKSVSTSYLSSTDFIFVDIDGSISVRTNINGGAATDVTYLYSIYISKMG